LSVDSVKAPPAPVQPPAQAAARPAAARTVPAPTGSRPDNDGDGRKGAAARNDGDAAARAAAQPTKSTGRIVDVKA
jgi:hypothetical protein